MGPPDKITIDQGKYAFYVRLHHGSQSDTWRKGPYKRERAFVTRAAAIEHAQKAFKGVPIAEPNRRGRRSRPNRYPVWSNPGMDAAQFCEAVKSLADLNGKTLWCQHESRLAGERHDTVYMNFFNLTPERVKEKRGGGAEAENNRVLLKVEGFSRSLGESPPTGKVKFETVAAYPHKPLRGKTGTPEAVAKYVADYLSKIAQTPSNLTHANPRRRTSRKKKRTSRRSR